MANLTAKELKRARKANPTRIGYYAFPKRQGGPCYTADQVQDYIDRTYLKAPACAGNQRIEPTNSGSESYWISRANPSRPRGKLVRLPL